MSLVNQWRSRLAALPDVLLFGKFPIQVQTVFHATNTSFAFTNLKPVIPGHVLVSPHRVVPRLADLTDEETADLFLCASTVGKAVLAAHPHADSLTVTIQDGRSAGQTVPHVHIHVMPRWSTDRFNTARAGNDAVYEAIDKSEDGMCKKLTKVDEDFDGKARTHEEMISEGKELRVFVEHLIASQ